MKKYDDLQNFSGKKAVIFMTSRNLFAILYTILWVVGGPLNFGGPSNE